MVKKFALILEYSLVVDFVEGVTFVQVALAFEIVEESFQKLTIFSIFERLKGMASCNDYDDLT